MAAGLLEIVLRIWKLVGVCCVMPAVCGTDHTSEKRFQDFLCNILRGGHDLGDD